LAFIRSSQNGPDRFGNVIAELHSVALLEINF
jgi:hypothetical protein